MIHLVTSENWDQYKTELREYHRLRHEVYVVERQWSGLKSRDDHEYDDYDNDEAIYLLSIDGRRVIGGSRLYPTLKPHMLETVCPQLAEVHGIPRGPDILEWTRIFVTRDRRESRAGGRALGELFAATVEYAVEEGITDLSVTFEAWWLPRLQALGWRLRPLGLPGLINGEWWIAATLAISNEALYSTLAYYGIASPVVSRHRLPQRRIGQVA